MLQWGRDRQVADRRTYRSFALHVIASFNGAATVRSRIGVTVADGGAGQRPGFNGAATVRSRIATST